jgi:hypothetical protein
VTLEIPALVPRYAANRSVGLRYWPSIIIRLHQGQRPTPLAGSLASFFTSSCKANVRGIAIGIDMNQLAETASTIPIVVR